MNFSRNSSNFFHGKKMKNIILNKFSCKFFNSNLYNTGSKNFINFSNFYFMSNLQRMVILSKFMSSIEVSKLMIGELTQKGESLLESTSLNVEEIGDGTNKLSDLILLSKSK